MFEDCTRYALRLHRAEHLSPELVELLEKSRADARFERIRRRQEAYWTPERIRHLQQEADRVDRRLRALGFELSDRPVLLGRPVR